MTGGCRYFDSDEWQERLEEHVGRVWDIETALRTREASSSNALIESIADTRAISPQEVACTSLAEAGNRGLLADVPVTLGSAASRWQARQDWLPDHCPHESVTDDSYCQYHMHPSVYDSFGLSGDTVQADLRHQLRTDTEQSACFVGATFTDLNLRELHVPSDQGARIDFRLSTVTERVQCADATIHPAITFEGAVLGQHPKQQDSSATGTAPNRYLSVDATVDFGGTHFTDTADFKHAVFAGPTSFNGATFDDIAMFNYARMRDAFEFWATASGKVDFSKTRFQDTAQLRGDYRTAGIFNYATFDSPVVFWNSTFAGKAEFLATTFHDRLDASHTTFDGFTRFCETTFNGTVSLHAARFHDRVHFRRIDAESTSIDLTASQLTAGVIEWDTPTAFFDVSDATIGGVALKETSDGALAGSPFDYLAISRTTFDGFDFGRHAGSLKPRWRLETFAPGWPPGVEAYATEQLKRYEDLEDTYLRAKSGANQAGHNKAASEFFRHEMKYRRKQHASHVRNRLTELATSDPSRLRTLWRLGRAICWTPIDMARRLLPWRAVQPAVDAGTPAWLAGYRWGANSVLDVVSGYGERPQRPIITSLFLICGFAVLYAVLGVATPVSGPSAIGYLLLSLQSFITFILGSSPVETGILAQFLSAVEGFAGAFLIAIFVFTLTRSIHR